MKLTATQQLACDLICRSSVTPNDEGCQDLIASRLIPLGFHCETMNSGKVHNLWMRQGQRQPLLLLAGHTDVVPPGLLADWHTNPFEPVIKNGILYGRGVADMKGGLAAMVVATENFLRKHPDYVGSIAFLLTSDEEGPAIDGTVKVVEKLINRREIPDWCIVGEPSSEKVLADTVKNGRRGSLHCILKIYGQQGHVAYPNLADNPLHRAFPVLDALCKTCWDKGNQHFPPTSFQVVKLKGGEAENIIPGVLEVHFNFRFSSENSADTLQKRVESILDSFKLKYHANWYLSGKPFLTPDGYFLKVVKQVIANITGNQPILSTAGGTSDGRFIATMGTHVVELGLLNRTIHQVNECSSLVDLENLTNIYEAILLKLFNV